MKEYLNSSENLLEFIDYFMLSDLNSESKNADPYFGIENASIDIEDQSKTNNNLFYKDLFLDNHISLMENINKGNQFEYLIDSKVKIIDIIYYIKAQLEAKQLFNKILFIPKNKIRKNPILLDMNKPSLMAIINCTPDSTSNAFLAPSNPTDDKMQENLLNAKYDKIMSLLKRNKNSISFIDIGGESTRPGALEIDENTEFERIERLVTRIRNDEDLKEIIISVDTRKVNLFSMYI